jgi:sortase A
MIGEALPAMRRDGGMRGLLPLAAALLLAVAAFAFIGRGVAIHAKAFVAQILLDRAFARSLEENAPVKPWSWADTRPVAKVEVERIGLEAIVLKGGSGQALAFGPGHLEGTAIPGEEGTAVIAAHRDTHFAGLAGMRLGDEIRLTRGDGVTVWFRVAEMSVATWDASGIDPHAEGRWLVLSTCWPFGATEPGPLRFLVKAQMIATQRSMPR